MTITKFHTSVKCKQSAVLREYIEMNSRKRAATDNDFLKNLYKLLNNAVYGKMMEDVRKYVTIKIVMSSCGGGDPVKCYVKYSS